MPTATKDNWEDIWWCLNSYYKIEIFDIRPFLEAFDETTNSDHLAEIFLRTKCDEEILELFLDYLEPGSSFYTESLIQNS